MLPRLTLRLVKPRLVKPRLLAVLACVCLLGSPALAAEKREVADKNFVWTLPSGDWKFVEPDASLKEGGYVVGVEHKDGQVKAWARVVPAEGLKAADLADEVKTAMAEGLTKQGRSQVGQGRLSGLAGSTVAVSGEKGGVAYLFLGFVIGHEGSLHSLLIDVYNGVEKDLGGEIDALKRGYRLIKGAGPEEAPMGAAPVMGDDAAPMQGEEFPAGGPKREGRAAVFPSHNVRWSLPEGSPFGWARPTNDEKKVGQVLIEARARAERKPENADEPKVNLAQGRVDRGPAPARSHPRGAGQRQQRAGAVHQGGLPGQGGWGQDEDGPRAQGGQPHGRLVHARRRRRQADPLLHLRDRDAARSAVRVAGAARRRQGRAQHLRQAARRALRRRRVPQHGRAGLGPAGRRRHRSDAVADRAQRRQGGRAGDPRRQRQEAQGRVLGLLGGRRRGTAPGLGGALGRRHGLPLLRHPRLGPVRPRRRPSASSRSG